MAEKVTLYGSPACASVVSLRKRLEQAGVEYEYLDIARDSHARQRVRDINHGNESVPTLVFPDGSTLTEPSPHQLDAALARQGYAVGSTTSPPASTWVERLRPILQHPAVRILGIVLLLAGMLRDVEALLIAGAVILAAGLLIGKIGAERDTKE
jgi:mycoredoxin